MFTQLTLTSMFHRSLLPWTPWTAGRRPAHERGRAGGVVHNPTLRLPARPRVHTVAFGTPYENIAMRQADVFV
jgi:hypothetical protein